MASSVLSQKRLPVEDGGNMTHSLAHFVPERTGNLRVSHVSKISPNSPPLNLKAVSRTVGVPRRGMLCPPVSSRMLNKTGRTADLAPAQSCSASVALSLCPSLVPDHANDAPQQMGLPSTDASYLAIEKKLSTRCSSFPLEATWSSTVGPAASLSAEDQLSKGRRPRTIEEALRILDGSEACFRSTSRLNTCKTSPVNLLNASDSDAVGDRESARIAASERNRRSSVRHVEGPLIQPANDPLVSVDDSLHQRVVAQPQANRGSEEDEAAEKPLTVDLVSSLSGSELHAEVQVLIARSMKLTTIDARRGGCDWKKFTALSVLSLSHNRLVDIIPLTVLAPTLTDVNVNFNRLTDLSPLFSCKRLQRLSAAHNHVASIVGVGNCKDVETLILFHNCLQGKFSKLLEHLASLPKLKDLDIEENPLLIFESAAKHSDPGTASLTSEEGSEGSTPEFTPEALRSLSLTWPMLRQLLAKCPSLKTFAGIEVQPFRSLATNNANVSTDKPTPLESTFRKKLSDANMPTEKHAATAGSGSIDQTTLSCSDGESPARISNGVRQLHEDGGEAAATSSDESSPENDSILVLNDTEEPDATSDPEKLRQHIRQLRQENRNMYALLEENEELCRHVQYTQYYCSAFTSRSQSARLPFQALGTVPARPRTAALLKHEKTPTGALSDPPVMIRSLEGNALCGNVTVHLPSKPGRVNHATIPDFSESCGVSERSDPLSGTPPSAGHKGNDVQMESSPQQEKPSAKIAVSVPVDDADNEHLTAALKWENDMLKQRLDRMVKYVQLLREDLDNARLNGIRPRGEVPQKTKNTPPSDVRCARLRTPLSRSPRGGDTNSGVEAGRRLGDNTEVVLETTVFPYDTSTKSACIRGLSESGLKTKSSSPSALDTMEKHRILSSTLSEATCTQTREALVSAVAGPRANSDSEQQTSGGGKNAPAQYLRSNDEPGQPLLSEANQFGCPLGSQLTVRHRDKKVADMLNRNKESLKVFRRELRGTEWIHSRPTSACSSVTQSSSQMAGPKKHLRLGERGIVEPAYGFASKGVTKQSGWQSRNQNSLSSAGAIEQRGCLPLSAAAGVRQKEGCLRTVEKTVMKQSAEGPGLKINNRQQSRGNAPQKDAVSNAARLQFKPLVLRDDSAQRSFVNRDKERCTSSSIRTAGGPANSGLLITRTLSFTSTARSTDAQSSRPAQCSNAHRFELSRKLNVKNILPPLRAKDASR